MTTTREPLSVFGFEDNHACGYYRILLPFSAFGAEVRNATHCGWTDDARNYRVIVGQRIGRHSALPIWRRLRPNHRLVYETDDDMWTIDPSNMAAYRAHTPDVYDAIEQSINASHMVTVSTEPLAEVLRRFHDNVVVLPNCIDPGLLDVERPRRDRVTVGWAGGDSHLRDFAAMIPQLRRFLDRNPRVDFHNMGTSYLDAFRLRGRHTGWADNIWDYYRTVDFDVGIAPLTDTVFNRSKSAIKAMEYAALGIPVVASDTEPYRAFVLDGVTGFLVRNEHEWGKRLYELASDEAMRVEMGAKAKAHVAQWTVDRHAWRWQAAYESLL